MFLVSCELGRILVLIAESDLNDPRIVRRQEAGGYGIQAQWNDDFHHSLHTVLTGEQNGYYRDFGRIGQLACALQQAFVYVGQVSPFRERPHGRKPTNIPGWRFLGYLQNHDQIGNRALGDRSSHLLSRGKLMIGAALVMTAPFVPMLFEGEEWGASTPFLYFTQHEEDWLVHAVSDGRRKEFAAFGWAFDEVPDPQEHATFARSKLNWNEIAREPHASLLDWHKRLIQLRRSHRELSDGRLDRVQVRFDEDARWLSMERSPFIIASNFAENEQQLPLPGSCEVVLASADITLESRSASLPAESVAILRRN